MRAFFSESASQAKGALPYVMRSLIMVIQVSGKPLVVAQDGESSLEQYTAFLVVESLVYVVYEALQSVVNRVANVNGTDNEEAKIRNIFRQGAILSGALWALGSGLGLLAAPILKEMDYPDSITKDALPYFGVISATIFFDLVYRLQAKILIGRGLKWPVFATEVLQCTTDLGLCAYFLLGSLNLGVMGAAYSYLAAAFLSAVAITLFMRLSPKVNYLELGRCESPCIDTKELLTLVKSSGAWGANSLAKCVYMTALVFCLGAESRKLLGAAAPALAYSTLVSFATDGGSEEVSVRISDEMGELSDDSAHKIRRTGFVGLWNSSILNLLVAIPVLIFAEPIAQLYLKDHRDTCDEQCIEAVNFLRMQVPIQAFLVASNMLGYSGLCVGWLRFVAGFTAVSQLLVSLPLLLLSQKVFDFSPEMTFGSQGVSLLFLTALFSIAWSRLTLQDLNKTENNDTPLLQTGAEAESVLSGAHMFAEGNERVDDQDRVDMGLQLV